jgi:integral membrane protein (TIGR01906 family)
VESSAPSLGALAIVRVLAAAVITIAVPCFLVTSAVRWTTLDTGFYLQEFAKYRVGFTTGLSPEQLRAVADAFAAYFQAPPGAMDLVVDLPSGRQPLFNARELHHMEDVQLLMHRVFQLWIGSAVALLLGVAAVVLVQPASAKTWALGAVGAGGLLTVLIVASIGLAAAIDFNGIFIRFHLVSFTNDLWLLDPTRDRLIQLFPLGFFFDSAMRIAVSTILAGAVLCAGSLALLRLR